VLSAGDLPGWRAADDAPGIAELAPDLSGLRVMRRIDSRALVRAGAAVRATTFVRASADEAAAALARAEAPSYPQLLVHELHGPIERVSTAEVGYRLRIGRPAESGYDTIEVYAIRRGHDLVLVELVSAGGFGRARRDEILDRVSR
jgi:hypothetical protein